MPLHDERGVARLTDRRTTALAADKDDEYTVEHIFAALVHTKTSTSSTLYSRFSPTASLEIPLVMCTDSVLGRLEGMVHST